MKPTKFLTLLMPTVIAWSFVYVAVRLITLNGGSIPVATNTVLVTLPAIAVLELVFAWPVLRYSKDLKKFVAGGVRPKRVDPFYATKVLALAKATSIAGALFLGAAIGLVLMQLGAPVVPLLRAKYGTCPGQVTLASELLMALCHHSSWILS